MMRSNWTDADVDNHYRSIHRDSHGYDPLDPDWEDVTYDDLNEILYEDDEELDEYEEIDLDCAEREMEEE